MYSLNKVQMIGNLGKGGVTKKFTPTGKVVASFSVAMNSKFKNAQGVSVENTEWANCEVWGTAADLMAEFTKQGSKVYVEGRLKTDKVAGVDGAPDKYYTKVVVQEFMFLDGKSNGQTVVADAGADEAPILPGQPVLEEAGIEF